MGADRAIRAEVPLPLSGIISDRPMRILAGRIAACQRFLFEVGRARENSLVSAQVVTFIAIPALRIRERESWDVRRNQVVPLIVEGTKREAYGDDT